MQTSIKKLTNEHEEWKNTLAFYKDEIKFFKNKLAEVALNNSSTQFAENIEHYQNKLDINDEKISILKHEIDSYVHHVFKDTQEHGNHITNTTGEEFNTLKNRMETTSRLYLELKDEYKKFLEKAL